MMAAASAIPSDVCFLSYSRSDEDFALRLTRDLQSRGVEMWVDRFNIRPSEHWDRAIERAIRSCRNVVAILSPRSVASENVADEISLAIDAGKPIIPVVIEPCDLPLRLTRRHLIDATGRYDLALKQCFDEIDGGQGTTPSAAAIEQAVAHDSEQIAIVKSELAEIVGPIAQILVDRAAPRAESIAALYRLLALHITNDADRARFLACGPELPVVKAEAAVPAIGEAGPAGAPIRASDLERIGHALTSFIGPIAPFVTKEESDACRTVSDLLQRLAAKLHDEGERTAFFRQLDRQERVTSAGRP